jgi:hypothetical protein
VLQAAVVTALILTASSLPAAEARKTCVLRSRRAPGSIDRVVAVLEVGGDLKFVDKDEVKRAKMSVASTVTYEEKTLALPTDNKDPWRSIRHYGKADAVIKVDRGGAKRALRADRRMIGVQIDGRSVTLFSPNGTLSREELDLIDTQGNSMLLDRLLPGGPVAQGDTWKHSKPLIAAILGLDEVGRSTVKSELSELSDTSAKIEMTGRVEGAVCGVSTRIALRAKYRFNRKTGRINWFGLLVKEDRDIGHVARGLDVVARLRMQIEPIKQSEKLSKAALAGMALEPNAKTTQLAYRSADGGWQFTHGRSWYVTDDEHDLAVLRLIDRGELVAQCNVAPLPKVKPGRQTTLAKFQEDIREALGDHFGEFVEAARRTGESNYRVLRVVVRGLVSDLPIQWNYYLIADEHGHQVAFTFTVEASLVERLGRADRELVDTLRFRAPEVAAK